MLSKFEKYDELIKSRLKEKRYIHSVNVAKKAAELAKDVDADEDTAFLAGLLHDICKNDTNENILKIFDEFGIILDDISKNEPKLWHAIAGSALVYNSVLPNNLEIANAIRYHTTGRANMSALEKCVFLADFISDERDYDDVDIIRESVKYGIDFAVFTALKLSLADLSRRERIIHVDSVYAYDFYLRLVKNKGLI